MSVNRELPHVFVLPEDDANRQLANGFLMYPYLLTRNIRVLEEIGGWMRVLDRFQSVHIRQMERYPERFMVLLIDFDDREDRLDKAKAVIPDHLKDRVFVLGVWTDPEAFSANLGRTKEQIGREMAEDCREETDAIWGHDLLRHNAGEIDRLRRRVRPILF